MDEIGSPKLKFYKSYIIGVLLLVVGLLSIGLPSAFPKNQVNQKEALFVSPTPKESENTLGVEGQEVLVVRVVDGDTIEIEGGQKVRLVGVDTPETVDPRRPVGCFGKEASNETKKLIEGKKVILTKDTSETDQFSRLLRLVYLKLEDGNTLFVNDYLVRQGFAKASTYPPDVKFVEQFLQAEEEARANNRGLWQKC